MMDKNKVKRINDINIIIGWKSKAQIKDKIKNNFISENNIW